MGTELKIKKIKKKKMGKAESFMLACNVKRLLRKMKQNLDFIETIRRTLLRRFRLCKDVNKKKDIETLLIHYYCVFASQLIISLFYRKFEAYLLHEPFLDHELECLMRRFFKISIRYIKTNQIYNLFIKDVRELKDCDIENLTSLRGKFGNYHTKVNALADLPSENSKIVYDIRSKKPIMKRKKETLKKNYLLFVKVFGNKSK